MPLSTPTPVPDQIELPQEVLDAAYEGCIEKVVSKDTRERVEALLLRDVGLPAIVSLTKIYNENRAISFWDFLVLTTTVLAGALSCFTGCLIDTPAEGRVGTLGIVFLKGLIEDMETIKKKRGARREKRETL